MNKHTALLAAALLSLSWTSASAGFRLIEHESCTEIKLAAGGQGRWQDGADRWVRASDTQVRAIHQNKMDKLSFSHLYGENGITFRFAGKKLIPDVIDANEEFTLYSQSYYGGNDNKITGKLLAFLDRNPATSRLPASAAQNGHAQRILLAALYFSDDDEKTTLQVPCHYSAGAIDPSDIIGAARCVWIDAATRSASGKPYCW